MTDRDHSPSVAVLGGRRAGPRVVYLLQCRIACLQLATHFLGREGRQRERGTTAAVGNFARGSNCHFFHSDSTYSSIQIVMEMGNWIGLNWFDFQIDSITKLSWLQNWFDYKIESITKLSRLQNWFDYQIDSITKLIRLPNWFDYEKIFRFKSPN